MHNPFRQFLPRDAIRKRGLCCRTVSVRMSARPSARLVDYISKTVRSFAVNGPQTWNSLPAELRTPDMTLYSFKRHLMPACFGSSLCCWWQVDSASLVWRRCVCSANLAPTINIQTYLLTYLRLKISSNFFFSQVAPSFCFFDPQRRYPIPRGTASAGAISTRWLILGDFRLKSPFISETVRDRTMIAMER